MDSTNMSVVVGSISSNSFEDPKFGVALLASQIRDSFFEVQTEHSLPTLALISKSASPLKAIDSDAEETYKNISVDGTSHYLLSMFTCEEETLESIQCMKTMWSDVSDSCDDFIGGIFTIEFVSDTESALIQVIKVNGWSQLRKHPFVRTDTFVHEIGNPLVEEAAGNSIIKITDKLGFTNE